MLQNKDKYRLDKSQLAALEEAIKGVKCDIFIFGSRTDLSKKGGDVDILIFNDMKNHQDWLLGEHKLW